jgi:hypothetical protein
MSLSDNVKLRFGGTDSQVLVNLTRNFDPDGLGTIDDDVLDAACQDVIADMETEAGVEYDEDPTTNPDDYTKHISCGVQCVMIKLQLNTQKVPGDKISKWLTERYSNLFKRLGQVTSRDRFFVLTDSPYQPSDQAAQGSILPDFDEDLLAFFTPGARDMGGSSNPLSNPI